MSTESPTAPDPAGAIERRREVLELTGWGLPFRLWQPHNYCFWVGGIIVAFGILQIPDIFKAPGTFSGAIVSATIAVALYGLLFIAFLRTTDHYERQPRKLVAAAFLWGGFGAVGLAITANDALLQIYPKLFGQAFGYDWSAALAAPFTEEIGKAAGFILLIGLAPRLIRSAYDGVFIGAFIGLGFQLVENITYSYNSAAQAFGADQVHASLATFAIRAAIGVFSHTLFSAIFCCGIIFVLGTPVQTRRLGLGLGLIALAMITHGVWDSSAAITASSTGGGIFFGILIGLIALGLLLLVIHRAVPQEREFLRGVMEPEVDNGTITAAELDALCAPKKQRKKFVHAGKGHKAHRSAKHVLRASLDLAHEVAAAGGEDSPGVEHERSEIARLRQQTAPA